MDYDVEIIQNQYHPIDRVNNLISMDDYPDDWIIINTELVTNENKDRLIENQIKILKSLISYDDDDADLEYAIIYSFNDLYGYLSNISDTINSMLCYRYNIIYAICPILE